MTISVREAANQLKFEHYICQRGTHIPEFQYWRIVLELELLLHIYVHSLKVLTCLNRTDLLGSCLRSHQIYQVDPISSEEHG